MPAKDSTLDILPFCAQENSMPYMQPRRSRAELIFVVLTGMECSARMRFAFIACVTDPVVKINFDMIRLRFF